MISEATVRRWYTPVEVSTLRRWLVVSFVVNLLLLSVDLLRGGTTTVLLGLLGLGLIAALVNALPKESSTSSRDASLVLGGGVLLLSLIHI